MKLSHRVGTVTVIMGVADDLENLLQYVSKNTAAGSNVDELFTRISDSKGTTLKVAAEDDVS